MEVPAGRSRWATRREQADQRVGALPSGDTPSEASTSSIPQCDITYSGPHPGPILSPPPSVLPPGVTFECIDSAGCTYRIRRAAIPPVPATEVVSVRANDAELEPDPTDKLTVHPTAAYERVGTAARGGDPRDTAARGVNPHDTRNAASPPWFDHPNPAFDRGCLDMPSADDVP